MNFQVLKILPSHPNLGVGMIQKLAACGLSGLEGGITRDLRSKVQVLVDSS